MVLRRSSGTYRSHWAVLFTRLPMCLSSASSLLRSLKNKTSSMWLTCVFAWQGRMLRDYGDSMLVRGEQALSSSFVVILYTYPAPSSSFLPGLLTPLHQRGFYAATLRGGCGDTGLPVRCPWPATIRQAVTESARAKCPIAFGTSF